MSIKLPGSPQNNRTLPRPRVLLADDNTDMRDYIVRILSEGYDVKAVPDGESAFMAASKQPFDLVLSDVMLPRPDGFDLVRKLRSHPATRTIPVILLSARVGEELRVEGLEQGADDYLIKPFSARDLLARVDTQVKLQRLRWEAQAEKQTFSFLVENSSEFIGMCDMEYRPFFINEAGMAMVGVDNLVHAQQIPVKDFFFPEDQPFLLNEFFPRVLQEGRAEIEIRFRHFKTGEALWMISNVFYLRGPDGNPIGLATVSRNITERKQIEEALRESEQRFARFMQHLPGLAWIKDLQGHYVYANDAASVVFHNPPERLYGKTDEDIFTPEIASQFKENDRHALESRTGIQTIEMLDHQDGVLHHSLVSKFPILGPDGQPILVGGMAIDITERKQAEQALQKSEMEARRLLALNQTIMINMGEGMYTVDSHGLVTYINPEAERLLGWEPGELLGCRMHDVTHYKHPDGSPFPIEECMGFQVLREGKVLKDFEDTFIRKDGSFFPVSYSASPLPDHDGEIVGLVIVFRDITKRKQDQEDLRRWKDKLEVRVQERTRELLCSQERLRSLASQLSLTEQRERRKLASDLHDYLAQLLVVGRMKLKQGKKIFSLFPAADNILLDVDHILEQALVYSRTTIAELSPPALNETGLPTALMWLAERMHKHGLQVKIDTNQKQVHLPEDRAVLLFQSVRELLFNVLKHAGVNQANVSIHVEQDGEVRVSVEDLGKGLDSEAMQRALEPGHLGLFAVRERMGAMGGRVELTSAPGQGTNVRLVLPACPQHSDMAEMELRKSHQSDPSLQQNRSAIGTHSDDSADTMPISTLRRIRVLLVDDHVMVRKGLHILLASYDRVEIVGEAGDGEEAVAMAERLMPHVVVMDLNMPKLNGIEATRRIMRDWPDIKVIGLSINDELEMRRAMINAGAVASLQKTGAATELYQAICASFPDLRPSIQKDLLEQ